MTASFQVEINGRVRTIAIEPADGRYRVTVDGEARLVDAARLDAGTLSLLVDAVSWTVGVGEPTPGGERAVSVDGARIQVLLSSERGRWGRRGAAGPQKVTAPMPGKVVRVLVQEGDTVKARQPLLVVEAMKMENELRSPKDGIVAEIRVAEGTSVEAGSLLAVVE